MIYTWKVITGEFRGLTDLLSTPEKERTPLFAQHFCLHQCLIDMIVSTLTSPRFLLLLLLCSNILTIKAPKLAQFTRTLSYCDWCWTIFGVTALLHNGTAGLCGDDDLDWLAFSLLIFLTTPSVTSSSEGDQFQCARDQRAMEKNIDICMQIGSK